MKIGVLTFHNAINYGAALQTYATQEIIKELGHDVKFINYENPFRRKSYNMFLLSFEELKKGNFKASLKYFLGVIFFWPRKMKFRKFYSSYIALTSKVNSSKELKEVEKGFEKVIVGSDQVWNPINNGKDTTYLLDFVSSKKKKISYSSSFGVSSLNEMEKSYEKFLRQFSSLSTREESGADLVMNLIGVRPFVVLDPVFLRSKEDWLKLASTNPKFANNTFVYTNKKGQYERFIDSTGFRSKSKILKLSRNISVMDFVSSNTKINYSPSIEDFLGQVNQSELVVSASFHCISMAIIFEKQFVAILTGNDGKDQRIKNILHKLGLEDRIFCESMDLEQVNKKINYEEVKNEMNKLKDSSLGYLKASLEV